MNETYPIIGNTGAPPDPEVQSYSNPTTFHDAYRLAAQQYGTLSHAFGFEGALPLAYTTTAELRRREQRRIGNIIKAPRDDYASRLFIQSQQTVEGLPSFEADAADLVIVMDRISGLTYLVPGYELIGYNRRANAYAFRYDAEKDPYEACTTLLKPDQLEKVIQTATIAGADVHAEKLKRTPALTIDGFVTLTNDSSVYHAPRNRWRARQLTRPKDAVDIRQFVDRKKRYSIQCDSVAAILRVFISKAQLGHAGSALGMCFTPSERGAFIAANLHEQVPFIDRETGRLHMLDATPAGEEVEGLFGESGRLRRLAAKIGELVGGHPS